MLCGWGPSPLAPCDAMELGSDQMRPACSAPQIPAPTKQKVPLAPVLDRIRDRRGRIGQSFARPLTFRISGRFCPTPFIDLIVGPPAAIREIPMWGQGGGSFYCCCSRESSRPCCGGRCSGAQWRHHIVMGGPIQCSNLVSAKRELSKHSALRPGEIAIFSKAVHRKRASAKTGRQLRHHSGCLLPAKGQQLPWPS